MADVNQSGKRFQFSIQALNDVLTETKSIRKKLAPFLALFASHEMSSIYDTLNYLHICMTTPKSNLTFKFNSLFALKVLFDTSDYVLVNWIEVFFLPHLLEIAKSSLTNQANGKDYFMRMGYTAKDEPDIQKFGFNYTLLATEMIQVAAMVKPYRLFESSFINSKSEFLLAWEELKRAGYKSPQKLAIYTKPQIIEGQVTKYKQGLDAVSDDFIDIYQDFSTVKLGEYLDQQHGKENEKYEISIVQLYESGDLFLSSAAVEICKAELKQPKSLLSFLNSLNVFHRLMVNADFQAFYVLNNEDTLQQALIQVVECDKAEKSIKRGSKFLSRFKNPKLSSIAYLTFLSYLQKWSFFASSHVAQNENALAKVVVCLKNQEIQLNRPQNWQVQKKKFDQWRGKNKERNTRLQEEIQKKASVLEEVLTKHLKSFLTNIVAQQIKPATHQPTKPASNIASNNMNTPLPSSVINNQDIPFLRKMNYVQQVCDRFLKDSSNYDKNKTILEEFNFGFQEQLLSVPQDVFDQLSERAFDLQKKIQSVIKLGEAQKSMKKQEQRVLEQKVSTKKIQSQVVVQKPITQQRNPQRNQRKDQQRKTLKQPIIDTPVKNFEVDYQQQNFYERQNVEKLGYKAESVIPTTNQVQGLKEQMSKDVNKLGYGVEESRSRNNKTQQVRVSKVLGYEYVNELNKQQGQSHSSQLGYSQSINQKVPKIELNKKEQEIQSHQRLSNRSIRKTEDLSQSRKKVDELSIQSNSRVEHFSPQSSGYNEASRIGKSDFKKKEYEFQQEELDIPLEQQSRQNFSMNRPKEFRSLSANRELKSKAAQSNNLQISPQRFDEYVPAHQSRPSYPNEPVMPFSNTNSPSNFEYTGRKRLQPEHLEEEQYEDILQDDYIDQPSINPLEESFHDIHELQLKIKSNINSHSQDNSLSFKNCFETDKYILQNQQDKKSKLYWLENDTTNLVKNIIMKKDKSKISKINVPQLLQEKNKRHLSELKAVEEQKNSRIQELQSKIKNLQKQSTYMKDQLTQQVEEIKTLKAFSEYDKQSVGQKGYLQDMQNIAAQKFSSPTKFAFSGVRGLPLDSNNRQNLYLDPKGKLINSKSFRQYFEQFRKEKEKKLLLKSKDLLYKDKDIEIGFMSKKQNDKLIVTFYITPEKDVESFNWTISQNDSLVIEQQPHAPISYIRTKKQEKLFFTVAVKKIYYTLPEIEFIYTIENVRQTTKILLPCPFHKFFFIKESDVDLNNYFKVNQKIIRGEQVPYSKRILKNLDSLKEYFQCINVLNRGLPNAQGQISYGGIASYKGSNFPIRISIKPNQFLYVQGVNEHKDLNGEISLVIQYYISLITHLLMKEIE